MTKAIRFCSGDTILEENPVPSASKPIIILPWTAILNPFSLDFNMLIDFRCASYHRRPPPRCCGAFENPSYDTVSAVTPCITSKVQCHWVQGVSPMDRFVKTGGKWKGLVQGGKFGKKDGVTLSRRYAHMSLVHFLSPPCNRAVLKNYQTKQRQL